jgi:hypothetical protein
MTIFIEHFFWRAFPRGRLRANGYRPRGYVESLHCVAQSIKVALLAPPPRGGFAPHG